EVHSFRLPPLGHFLHQGGDSAVLDHPIALLDGNANPSHHAHECPLVVRWPPPQVTELPARARRESCTRLRDPGPSPCPPTASASAGDQLRSRSDGGRLQ